MQRATKKACGSLDTILSPDFISRALESNPLELLNNEALKLEYFFGSDPLLEYKAYHDKYSVENLRATVRESYGKTWNRVLTAVALRQDIPEEHALHYAVRVENKKLVQNIIKLRPEWLEWEYLIQLYRSSLSPAVSREVLMFGNSNEYSALVEFYHRAAPTKDIFWKGFCAFINTSPQIKWKNAQFRVSPSLITKKYMPYILDESNTDVVAKFILYNQGLRHEYAARETFIDLFEYLVKDINLNKVSSPPHDIMETVVKWMLRIGAKINDYQEGGITTNQLRRFISFNLWDKWKPSFELALEKVLWDDYKANKGRGSKTSTAVKSLLTGKYAWVFPLTSRGFDKRNKLSK